MNIFSSLIAAAAGLTGICLGFFLSRWQKHRELIYSRKLELYSELVTALLEFGESCAPKSSIIIQFDKFGRLINKLTKAGIVMPSTLYNDIHATTRTTTDRMGATRELLEFVNDVKCQAPCAEERFYALKKTLEGEGKERFNGKIFEPLLESIPDIIRMLKNDLGIERLGSSFYKKRKYPHPLTSSDLKK